MLSKAPFNSLVRRRIFLQGSAAMAASLMLPTLRAHALTPDEVKAASGDVNMLVWEGYEPKEAFDGLDNITIKRSFIAQNDDSITKTVNPGDFDIVSIFQGQINILRKLNRIKPIDTSLLSNFPDMFPYLRDHPSLRRDGELYALPIVWGPICCSYNEEKTAKPESYRDLMKPELKGKVTMCDDPYAAITTFARFAGFDDANRLSPAQLDDVMKLLVEFKPQLIAIAPSYGEIPAMFKRGEVVASVVDVPNTVGLTRAEGMKVSWTVPKEGGMSYMDCWQLLDGVANEAGAYAVMDATISPHGQTVIGNYTMLGMVNPKAIPDIKPEANALYPYDSLEAAFERAPIYDGAPVDSENGTLATHAEWIQRWSEFKAA